MICKLNHSENFRGCYNFNILDLFLRKFDNTKTITIYLAKPTKANFKV
jgi:hypothetical protein